MRFRSAGDVRRIDLDPVLQLLPPLREEWTRLRFDASGRVVNVLSGEAQQTLVVIEGRHRQPAARYHVTVPARSGLVASGGESVLVTLHHDDEHRLVFTVSQELERWSIDVDLHHGSRPRVVLVGRFDLRSLLEADGTPGCLARLVAGPAGGTITVDLGALEGPSSPLIVAEAHAKGFHAEGGIDVGASGRRWRVDGQASMGGRGLGRLVLLVARRRIRRGVDSGLERAWAGVEEWISAVERDVEQLRHSVQEEGGPAAFVHRALWDPAFDPGPPFAGG